MTDPLALLGATDDERVMLVAGDRSWTRRQLATAIASRVAWLRARTAPLVACEGTADVDALEWMLACIIAGVPFLPLHPRWTAAERAVVLADAGDPPLVPPQVSDGLDEPPRAIDPETPLAVVYTSGTSGRPKGVVLSRRAFVASASASRANLGHRDDDRWLLALPPAHVGGLSILTRALCDRSAIVLAATDRFDETRLVAACAEHRVTLLSLVPTMLHRLLARGITLPTSVRAVLLGGAAAPPSLLQAAAGAGVPVLATYGLTEACSQVATQRPGTVNRGDLGAGPPLPGVEVRLVDERIAVRGPTLCSGYWPLGNHPSPFDADGFYDTGDDGRLDAAGNLHVFGRRSDLVIVGGENVRPSEVEAVAVTVPGVAEACALGVADPEWGQRLGLLLVATPGVALDAAGVVAAMASRLARFKRPTLAAVVPALPALGIGKLDRRRAAAELAPRLRPVGAVR